MNERKRSVLVVDDDDQLREAICQSLAQEGYDVTGAVNGADVTHRFWRPQFDAMIVDILMPAISGLAVMHTVNKYWPDVVVILLTGIPDADLKPRLAAAEEGYFTCLKKPCRTKDLTDALERALGNKTSKMTPSKSVS